MQESRLFKIVYYLLEHEKSTASELAEKFEVSVRTIYRDIDALSSAGIPICATQGKGGGIYLLDNFVLDRSVFSDNEKEQILTALKGISAADGNNLDELLTKLRALYSITKKMGEIIGVKVTKAGFAKGVSKAVPIVGGIISGGTSYVSMNHMGHRLSEVLRESIFYTEADYNKDYNEICNKAVEVKFE